LTEKRREREGVEWLRPRARGWDGGGVSLLPTAVPGVGQRKVFEFSSKNAGFMHFYCKKPRTLTGEGHNRLSVG